MIRLLVLLLALSFSVEAFAVTQAELLQEASAAEAAFEPARAAQLYARALDADPGSRLARRARKRRSWLEARKEGNYAPLTALMRMRALLPAQRTLEAVTRFDDQVRGFPEGRVRRESLALLANAYREDVRDPTRALDAYQRWLASPGLSEGERQLAESGAALSRVALGRGDESERALEAAGLSGRAEAVMLRAERIGRQGTWVALALILGFLLAGLALGRRNLGAWRRTLSPGRMALGLYLLLPPLLMVWLYDWRVLPQVAMVIAACAPVLLIANVFGSTLSKRQHRHLVAALAASATLGAAFIALHRSRLLFDIMIAWEQLS